MLGIKGRDVRLTLFVILPLSVLIGAILFELVVDRRLSINEWEISAQEGKEITPFYIPPWKGHTLTRSYFVNEESFKGKRLKRKVTYTFDRLGFRSIGGNPDYSRPINIALVGDSYTFADETPDMDTLHAALKKRFPGLNIANLGICGSNSLYYDDTLKYFREQIDVPIEGLVVGLYVDMRIGDVPRALAIKRRGERAYYRGMQIGPSTRRRIEGSRFGRMLFNFERKIRAWSTAVNLLFPKKIDPDFNVDLEKEGFFRDSFAEYETMILNNLNRIAHAANLPRERIVVWLAPSGHELMKIYKAKKGDKPLSDFYVDSFEFWDDMARRLEDEGYVVVDPRKEFTDLFIGESKYPFTSSGHYTGEAYSIIANTIAPHLSRWFDEPGGALAEKSE